MTPPTTFNIFKAFKFATILAPEEFKIKSILARSEIRSLY